MMAERKMTEAGYEICTKCFNVKDVGGWIGCYPPGSEHSFVEAIVSNCPAFDSDWRRVTRRRRLEMDRICQELGDEVHGPHHYGDPDRRHFTEPGYGYGRRRGNMTAEWALSDDGHLEQLPVIGDPEGAAIEVTVFTDDDEPGGTGIYVRCLCHACHEMDNMGVRESMGELADTPGVYYMEAWSQVYPSGPWGGEEYDGGIRIHEKDATEGEGS